MSLRMGYSFSILLAVMIGAYAYVSGAPGAISRQSPMTFEQPEHWVAFAADRRTTYLAQQSLGRYYRDANGSSRTEVTSPDGSETAISIQNRVRKMAWVRDPVSGTWAGKEMPKLRTAPDTFGPGILGLHATPEAERKAGFVVYRLDDAPSGKISLLAPALNFFPLVSELNGKREEYYNIRLGDPDPSLFSPPDGVPIRLVTELKDLFRPSQSR